VVDVREGLREVLLAVVAGLRRAVLRLVVVARFCVPGVVVDVPGVVVDIALLCSRLDLVF
jgi:hypothetical protein